MSITLDSLNYNFDCIIFTETFKIGDIKLFNIPGYNLIYNGGDQNKNDGVVMYLKDNLDHNIEIINLGVSKVIRANILYHAKTIIISALYRLPSNCPYEFNNDLKTYLKNYSTNENFHFFVGDINIDIKIDKDYCQEYLNIMSENGFVSLINNYTRESNNSKSCIDHIFLKKREEIEIKSFILKLQITDHFPVIVCITLNKKTNLQENQLNKINKITKINDKKLLEIISGENWDDIYIINNLELATNEFVKKVKEAIKTATVEIKLKNTTKKRSPWITQGLLKSVSTKYSLYKKMKNNPGNADTANEYKRYKNKLNELITGTKNNYFKKQIESNKYNSKNLWNVVNNYTNNSSHKTEIKKIDIDGNIITNQKEIADAYNSYYAKVGTILSKKIKKPAYSVVKRKIVEQSFFLLLQIQLK